jgi:hypothetical protein
MLEHLRNKYALTPKIEIVTPNPRALLLFAPVFHLPPSFILLSPVPSTATPAQASPPIIRMRQ